MTNNTDYLAWKAAAHAIKACEADAIAFQETNLAWNNIHYKRVHQILQASISHATITTSSSSKTVIHLTREEEPSRLCLAIGLLACYSLETMTVV